MIARQFASERLEPEDRAVSRQTVYRRQLATKMYAKKPAIDGVTYKNPLKLVLRSSQSDTTKMGYRVHTQ